MSKKEKRFEKTYSQGKVSGIEIWVDKETGVNYIFGFNGYAGGMTVLLDKEGKPIITKQLDGFEFVKEISLWENGARKLKKL